MLYPGAVLVEAGAAWLYINGYPLGVVACTAVMGVTALLVLDWFVERRRPAPGQ